MRTMSTTFLNSIPWRGGEIMSELTAMDYVKIFMIIVEAVMIVWILKGWWDDWRRR